MPRRKSASKREKMPDVRYGSTLVSMFINSMMSNGQKGPAAKAFYDSMEQVAQKQTDSSLNLFKAAIDNAKPVLEVKSRRVGGATYQVPVEIRPERRTSLAIRWILAAARERKEKTMAERLAGEFLDAAKNQGSAIKKKEDTHKMAEANKAFAHYRW